MTDQLLFLLRLGLLAIVYLTFFRVLRPIGVAQLSTMSREPALRSSTTGATGGGEPLVAGMEAGTGTATRFSVRSSTIPRTSAPVTASRSANM